MPRMLSCRYLLDNIGRDTIVLLTLTGWGEIASCINEGEGIDRHFRRSTSTYLEGGCSFPLLLCQPPRREGSWGKGGGRRDVPEGPLLSTSLSFVRAARYGYFTTPPPFHGSLPSILQLFRSRC